MSTYKRIILKVIENIKLMIHPEKILKVPPRETICSNRSPSSCDTGCFSGADEWEGTVLFLTEGHDKDKDIRPHNGEDEPDAHPEPDPLGEEKGRPQEPDEADEPEKEPCPQGSHGKYPGEGFEGPYSSMYGSRGTPTEPPS